MFNPGQPKALDDKNQKTVCALVAAGATLSQVAQFVGCDPKTIRREARRNDDFRCQLAKAKSDANIHPLQTLQSAAKTNWRAALRYMERLEPGRFSQPNAKIITQCEANKFAAVLIESIERAISSADERTTLFDLLTPAMPAPMRRRWNGHSMRRATERATQDYENMKEERARRECMEKSKRNLRRRNLWHEVGQWLPQELLDKFAQNEDLFDPEEVFAQPPGPGPLVSDAQYTYKVGSVGAQKYGSAILDRPDSASSELGTGPAHE
jgi:IS30 family transposase